MLKLYRWLNALSAGQLFLLAGAMFSGGAGMKAESNIAPQLLTDARLWGHATGYDANVLTGAHALYAISVVLFVMFVASFFVALKRKAGETPASQS